MSWLTSCPISDHGFDQTKQQFWDSLRLRYGWVPPNMPSTCFCSGKMDVQHAVSCKREGFVTIRHNDLRDLTGNLLSNMCNDVEIEPKLLPVTGENFSDKTTNTRTEARLDFRSREFWVRSEQAFFDIRVFDSNAKRYLNSFNNATHKMRKRKRGSTTRKFYKVSMEAFPVGIFNIRRYESRVQYIL